jgi:ABC-type anion transport system duplicated permease subunit
MSLGTDHAEGARHRQLHRRDDRQRRLPRIALGIGIMCIFVMGFNHFVWRRLYTMAESRLHF